MTPTHEQLNILDAAATRDNLLIVALAGTGKTSTLELVARALKQEPILSLAFNKRIADEMASRLPSHVKAQTLNSLGHGVWSRAIGKARLNLDAKKAMRLLKGALEGLPRSQRQDEWDRFSETLGLVRAAKYSGYIPPLLFPEVKRLHEVIPSEDHIDDRQQRLVDEVLRLGIKESYDGTIDFDDQIYMPTLFGGPFPSYPLIMVDEAQDLSALNHAMLAKLVRKRLIAVGDPWQSIYGFRGAVTDGVKQIETTYACRALPLSISFRCPRAVVERARWRVPHYQAAQNAPEGLVEVMEEWNATDIPDGAAIICRNNAPLFKLALGLIRRGRGVRLVGSDIGPGMVRTLRRLGPETLGQDHLLTAIDRWEVEALEKTKSKASVIDRADCLRIFAGSGHNLGAAIAYAEGLFAAQGPINLLSIHKAKGLEFKQVYHLDPWRIPSKWAESHEELEQEKNCYYVCITRAQEKYIELTLEGLTTQ